jgi:hypothetical protein
VVNCWFLAFLRGGGVHRVDVGRVADISEIYAASVFSVKANGLSEGSYVYCPCWLWLCINLLSSPDGPVGLKCFFTWKFISCASSILKPEKAWISETSRPYCRYPHGAKPKEQDQRRVKDFFRHRRVCMLFMSILLVLLSKKKGPQCISIVCPFFFTITFTWIG